MINEEAARAAIAAALMVRAAIETGEDADVAANAAIMLALDARIDSLADSSGDSWAVVTTLWREATVMLAATLEFGAQRTGLSRDDFAAALLATLPGTEG